MSNPSKSIAGAEGFWPTGLTRGSRDGQTSAPTGRVWSGLPLSRSLTGVLHPLQTLAAVTRRSSPGTVGKPRPSQRLAWLRRGQQLPMLSAPGTRACARCRARQSGMHYASLAREGRCCPMPSQEHQTCALAAARGPALRRKAKQPRGRQPSLPDRPPAEPEHKTGPGPTTATARHRV